VRKAIEYIDKALERVEKADEEEMKNGVIEFGSYGLRLYTNTISALKSAKKTLTYTLSEYVMHCNKCRKERLITPAELKTGYCIKCRPV